MWVVAYSKIAATLIDKAQRQVEDERKDIDDILNSAIKDATDPKWIACHDAIKSAVLKIRNLRDDQ